MNLSHALAPGLVAIACATATIAYATRPSPDDPHATSPRAAVVATPEIAGLVVGEKIAGWTITEIAATADGVDVRFERDRTSFAMSIVPRSTSTENPPFASKTHALYYGHARPANASIPAGALRAISAELVRRLDRGA